MKILYGGSLAGVKPRARRLDRACRKAAAVGNVVDHQESKGSKGRNSLTAGHAATRERACPHLGQGIVVDGADEVLALGAAAARFMRMSVFRWIFQVAHCAIQPVPLGPGACARVERWGHIRAVAAGATTQSAHAIREGAVGAGKAHVRVGVVVGVDRAVVRAFRERLRAELCNRCRRHQVKKWEGWEGF